MYDVKGRFTLVRVGSDEEAGMKLAKVEKTYTAPNGVPCLVTHDGRTIRYPDPLIRADDSLVLDLETGKAKDWIRFKPGVECMITGGANTGPDGQIVDVERHPGSFDIVHMRDANDNTFATARGTSSSSGAPGTINLTLPKMKGIRVPLTEDRERRIQPSSSRSRSRRSPAGTTEGPSSGWVTVASP
eukprot:Sspe_Gene.410::Locus_144_Transcript_3_4_Confidence_0.400_Length_935::g.410::m.410/K02987/RP-S4e, RPS4; small subunit ribosomal protein S4e